MANMEMLSVALPPDVAADLRAAVDGGEFASLDEAVRAALLEWSSRRSADWPELRRLVQEGIDSGPGLDADAVFSGLRARFGQPHSA